MRHSEYSTREKVQSRIFEAELYPDATNYDVGEVLDRARLQFYDYAYILHDKDVWSPDSIERWEEKNPDKVCPYEVGEDKKPHIHLVVSFEPRNNKQLGLCAKILGIPSNSVRKVRSKVGMYKYLIHLQNPEKFQYNPNDVVTNIPDFAKKYLSDNDSVMKANEIVEYILGEDRYLSVMDVTRWCISHYVWDEFRRGQHIFTSLINEHNALYERNV